MVDWTCDENNGKNKKLKADNKIPTQEKVLPLSSHPVWGFLRL
jgi:hypothetical protein